MTDSTRVRPDTEPGLADWFSEYAPWAFGLWIGQLLVALYSCVVANLVFRIPLGSVVDVLLSLQICAPLLLAVVYFVVSLLAWDFSDFFEFLTSILAYLLNPFAAILGYTAYAYFDGAHLADISFVYSGFISHVHVSLIAIATFGARLSIPHIAFIGSPQFFSWSNFVFGSTGLFLAAAQAGFRYWSPSYVNRRKRDDN